MGKTKMTMKPTKFDICETVRDKAIKMSFDPDLACWCAICSTAIAKAFIKHGYPAKIAYGDFKKEEYNHHCWVESEGKIYDVTATQFYGNYDSIVIMPVKEGRKKLYPTPKLLCPTQREKIKNFFKDWPTDQKPNKKIVERLIK